ncbi:MAG: AraC family transcriptional regulator [Leisingera sp.]
MVISSSRRLERSCRNDWLREAPAQDGLTRIEAFFGGHAYTPHRHDTYAIGYTLHGVQSFRYRGARTDSTAGRIMVIHPDELHDGQAGCAAGFRYRMMYVAPSMIRAALGPHAAALPFVSEAVFSDPRLLPALHAACGDLSRPLEPLERDHVVAVLAEGLLGHDSSARGRPRGRIDLPAMEQARAFLEAHTDRTVRSEELEEISQHDRYSLARQFRAAFGTSPYRYLTLRRLDRARSAMSDGMTLAESAALAGFSDQAHMTRQFRAAYGMAPGAWTRLARTQERAAGH